MEATWSQPRRPEAFHTPPVIRLISCWASLFLKLPFGSLAYRTNLLSCICTLAAALVIYKIMRSADQSVFSAAIAALAFGTFPLVWSQAILTEVYALNALFATLLLYFLVVSTSNPWMDWMGGIIMGLGLGNHLTLLFFMPLMFFDKAHKETLSFNKWLEKGTLHSYIKRIARRLVGLLLGLTVYFVIPLWGANACASQLGQCSQLGRLDLADQ